MRHFLKYDLIPLLSVLAVAAFPCVFIFAQNCDEVAAVSMVPFLLVYTVLGLAMTAACSVLLRNVSQGAFLASLALLVVINFSLLAENVKKVLPFLWERWQLVILLLVLLAVFLLLLRKKPDMRTACFLVLIAFGSMIVMNLVFALPTIWRDAHRANPEELGEPLKVEFGENRPNVYYFIFDEYGGYENLLNYYDYDNSEFLEAMEARGFTVARESRNTEAVETITIVPNLLNLNYVVAREDSKKEKEDMVMRYAMKRIFRENGYQVQIVNHLDYLGTAGARVLTKEQTRRTISEILLKNSLFNKFPKAKQLLDDLFSLDYSSNYRRCLDNALDAGLKTWETAQDGPTLTIGYVQCPHSPTLVGRNGEELPVSQGYKWLDHSLYLNQLGFISDYILELVDTIQLHDPDAMIIIQSDHGNRYPIHMWQVKALERYDPYVEEPYMKNILNCVYYQGQQFGIEGETGINTLRLMFREVLGADLPPVEPVYDYFFGYEDEGE